MFIDYDNPANDELTAKNYIIKDWCAENYSRLKNENTNIVEFSVRRKYSILNTVNLLNS